MNKFFNLNKKIIKCNKCPRLVKFRKKISTIKRKQYLNETYWGKPVTGFGDAKAKILFVGLAPAAHGGAEAGEPPADGAGPALRGPRGAARGDTPVPEAALHRAQPPDRGSDPGRRGPHPRAVPHAHRVLAAAVRGGLGPHQHRLGEELGHPRGHRHGGGPHLRAAALEPQRGRARAGHLGPGQHRGGLGRVPRPRAGRPGAPAPAAAAQPAGEDLHDAQRDLDAVQLLPREARHGLRARQGGAALPPPPDQPLGRRGPGGRLLGAVLPLRRQRRQDPGGHPRGRGQAPGGAPGPPAHPGAHPGAAHGGQHRDGGRQPDAGGDQLRGAGPAAPAPGKPGAQEEHQEGGLLDHLQHHGGEQDADPGRDGRGHYPPHRAPSGERGVRHQEGGYLGHLERHVGGHARADQGAGPLELHQAPLRPPGDRL